MGDKPGKEELDLTPVVRVELRRASLREIIHGDDLLRGCAFCAALPPESLEQLSRVGVARRFVDRAQIFKEADAGNSLFLVLRGEVRMTSGAGHEEVEVGVARKGDLFGESEALGDSASRVTSAAALGEADVAEFEAETVRALAERHLPMKRLLEDLRSARRNSRDQMKDFLNRW